jgi:hypothetical protein
LRIRRIWLRGVAKSKRAVLLIEHFGLPLMRTRMRSRRSMRALQTSLPDDASARTDASIDRRSG